MTTARTETASSAAEGGRAVEGPGRTPQRWLFVDAAPTFGGHEVMLLRLLSELADQHLADFHLLARADGRLRAAGSAWATPEAFAAVQGSGFPARVRRWVADAKAFVKAAARLEPGLCIVAEGCLLAQALFVLLARLRRIPVAVYVPLVDSFAQMGFRTAPLKDALVRGLYANLPDAWIVITGQQAEGFRAWSGTRRPILTLPNTVATAIEARQEAPVSAGKSGALRVLVLGRLDPFQKGLDFLLDYLEQDPASADGIHLTLAGDGPYGDEIRQRLAWNATLAAAVTLEGWADSVEILARHDILLLPSRFEGVPLVMLEAMILGVPVVASDLPGTRAYLPEDCLFPVGDLKLAFATLARLRDPAERHRTVAANRRCYAESASGLAFGRAVAGLAQHLRRLQSRSLTGP